MLDLIDFKNVPESSFWIHRFKPIVYKYVDETYLLLPIHKSGYLKVYDTTENKYLTFHRLRAMAFLPLPEGLTFSTAICNHKDGDKYNNAVENLEWTTYQGNNIHAVVTGLRNDCIAGRCDDLVTGTVYEFYSLWDLSRTIDYHAGMIQKYLSTDKDYPFKNRFQITLRGDAPKGFTKNDLWKSGPGSPTPVIVINTENGNRKVFGTFANMAKQFGENWVYKKKLLPGKILKFGIYTVQIATSYEDITAGHKENELYAKFCHRGIISFSRPSKRVSVLYPTGDVKIYSSLKVLAEHLGVKYTALKKRMSKYNGVHKDLIIKYL